MSDPLTDWLLERLEIEGGGNCRNLLCGMPLDPEDAEEHPGLCDHCAALEERAKAAAAAAEGR